MADLTNDEYGEARRLRWKADSPMCDSCLILSLCADIDKTRAFEVRWGMARPDCPVVAIATAIAAAKETNP